VLNCMRGDLARGVARTPRIPGHEYIGRVIDVGADVSTARLGERVAAYFYLFCGTCGACLAGDESLCERLRGFVGVDIDGGYAPFAVLPARNALPMPESLDPIEATAIPDAIATPVHVAALARIGLGDRVVIIGAGGGVGVHMVQVAKLCGAQVIGVEPNAAKRAFLQEAFAVSSMDPCNFSARIDSPGWERGPDVVVDLVGRSASVRWAVEVVRPNGRVVLLTTFTDVELPISPRELVFRQVSVMGSRYASRREVVLAADLVANGLVRPVVSDRVAAMEVDRLHQRLGDGTLLGRGAISWSEDWCMRNGAGRETET
jgi:D-arabinose 1-dehydrogenase-like Zn-dependent alcohol dehydrogenase